jgi:DNA-binding SARP family transcriptional activator
LFSEADDPLRALRWSLAELRRCLGDNASVDGDPVVLRLPESAAVDVRGLGQEWVRAVEVAGLGDELLDGLVVRGAPAFESWLLAERRRVAAASEAILHEAALGLMARGALDRARGFAVRAAAMSPLDENHQALLLRLYRLMGDDVAAERQHAAWTALLETELGVTPGAAIEAAMRERPRERAGVPTSATIEAAIESGSAMIAAGAIEPGVAVLRSAVRLADAGRTTVLRSRSRQVLAEALIHSLRGLDEEGLAHLHEADRLAIENDDPLGSALARAELGYVDFLRARYDRAELWLREALSAADGSPDVMAKAATYLGSVHSDTADYPQAIAMLDLAERLSREAGDARREAYALCRRAGSTFCGETSTRPTDTSPRPSRWPSASTGSPSCRGPRPSRARCGSPVGIPRVRPRSSSRPSPVPASSATPAGRASVLGGWPWWPTPAGTPSAPSRPWWTPERGARASRIRTCGSRSTSSTRCATSAVGTGIPTPAHGSTRCAISRPGPACGS